MLPASKRSPVVFYTSGFRTLVKRFGISATQYLSASSNSSRDGTAYSGPDDSAWVNQPDAQFPLPGTTATSQSFLDQANRLQKMEKNGPEETSTALLATMDTLECAIHDCPTLVRKNLADLFPRMNIRDMPLTAVTVTQKANQDMSTWSEEVEVERDELTVNFVRAAEEICKSLKTAGFWADFIDPTSGRPYMGPFTNATLFETDERYQNFGFTIEDLGCCKVIRHKLWGTHAFTGVLFTNAPLSSDCFRGVVDKCLAANTPESEQKKP